MVLRVSYRSLATFDSLNASLRSELTFFNKVNHNIATEQVCSCSEASKEYKVKLHRSVNAVRTDMLNGHDVVYLIKKGLKDESKLQGRDTIRSFVFTILLAIWLLHADPWILQTIWSVQTIHQVFFIEFCKRFGLFLFSVLLHYFVWIYSSLSKEEKSFLAN